MGIRLFMYCTPKKVKLISKNKPNLIKKKERERETEREKVRERSTFLLMKTSKIRLHHWGHIFSG